MAALVIVFAGIKLAAEIVVPFFSHNFSDVINKIIQSECYKTVLFHYMTDWHTLKNKS